MLPIRQCSVWWCLAREVCGRDAEVVSLLLLWEFYVVVARMRPLSWSGFGGFAVLPAFSDDSGSLFRLGGGWRFLLETGVSLEAL